MIAQWKRRFYGCLNLPTLALLPALVMPHSVAAQFVDASVIERIDEAAQRLFDIHANGFRDYRTLRGMIERSFIADWCQFGHTGIKLSGPLAVGTSGVSQIEFGPISTLSLEPSFAAGWQTNMGVSGSSTARARGLHWFCARLARLGPGVAPPYDIEDEEKEFQFFPYQPHSLPRSVSAQPRTEAVPSPASAGQSPRWGEFTPVLDMEPAEIANTLIANLVAQGLDPADESQVRLLILGPDLQQFAGLTNLMGDPVARVLDAPAQLQGLLDYMPSSRGLSDVLGSMSAMSQLDDLCSAGGGAILPYCEEAAYVAEELVRTQNLFETFIQLRDAVVPVLDGFESLAQTAIQRANTAINRTNAFINFVSDPFTPTFWAARNRANHVLSALEGTTPPLQTAHDTLLSFVTDSCKLYQRERTWQTEVPPFGSASCKFAYKVNPCSNEGIRYRLDCATSLGSIPGVATPYVSSVIMDALGLLQTVTDQVCHKPGRPNFNFAGLCG